MANYKATGKKAKHGAELAQRSRAAILNAMDVLESRGKTISQLLADEIENNPIKFMELASKFIPKDINAEISHVRSASELSDDEIQSEIHRINEAIAGITDGTIEPEPGAKDLH